MSTESTNILETTTFDSLVQELITASKFRAKLHLVKDTLQELSGITHLEFASASNVIDMEITDVEDSLRHIIKKIDKEIRS